MRKFNLKPIAAVAIIVCTVAQAQQTAALPDIVVIANPIIESNNVDTFSGFSTRVTDVLTQ